MQANDEPLVVKVEGLTRTFTDFWHRPKARALKGIDLEIRRGEVFGLLGPNGSGKSTTLKILLGLLRAGTGRVEVLGLPPDNVAVKDRIGYLPEESCLHHYLTPRETLEFYGRLFDLDAATRRERIRQLLDMVGLTHVAHRVIGEFSKGMIRRVGLAQALINDPDLVILDEPTAGLDPIACRQVKDLILALARRRKTVIISSHLLADIEDVCDRIAILYDGTIRAMGPVRQLLEQKDSVRLTLPVLPPEAMAAVLAVVRLKIGKDPEIHHPRMELEQFFLDVVKQAAVSPADISGAACAGAVAPFLNHE